MSKLRKLSIIAIVCSLATILLVIGVANATPSTVQINTVTKLVSVTVGGTTHNFDLSGSNPVALPPNTLVTFAGVVESISSNPPGALNPPQGTITLLQYQLVGASSWDNIPLNLEVNSDGSFDGQFTTPSEPGIYNLHVVFHGDNLQGGATYHWRNSEVTIPYAFSVPEYELAGLAALLSCFGAFIVVKKRDSLPQLFHR